MELEQILALVLFGMIHWILARILLEDLVKREHVLGGRKWAWAVAIIFVTFLGSLVYLLCHPRTYHDSDTWNDF